MTNTPRQLCDALHDEVTLAALRADGIPVEHFFATLASAVQRLSERGKQNRGDGPPRLSSIARAREPEMSCIEATRKRTSTCPAALRPSSCSRWGRSG